MATRAPPPPVKMTPQPARRRRKRTPNRAQPDRIGESPVTSGSGGGFPLALCPRTRWGLCGRAPLQIRHQVDVDVLVRELLCAAPQIRYVVVVDLFGLDRDGRCLIGLQGVAPQGQRLDVVLS